MDDIEKKAFKYNMLMLGVSLAISFSISFGMYAILGDAAFPWNLIVTIGVFIALTFFVQRRQFRKMGLLGSGIGKKSYTCYQCGTTHKMNACPKCGARGGRINF